MNTQRMLVLGVAALAAGAAALLTRGLLGGGTEKVKAAPPSPHIMMAQILVASNDLQPGMALSPSAVRWQAWPRSAVASNYIARSPVQDISHIVQGTVTRSAILAGEPVSTTSIVHADTAGFMAAMVTPGMRAVSIGISTETGAGGFILPNDRVDVVVTQQVQESPKRFAAHTLLSAVRVLAVDQTYREDNNQKVVIGKTATLELTSHQAEQVERASAAGQISLALRALGDDGVHPPLTAQTNTQAIQPTQATQPNQTTQPNQATQPQDQTAVTIIGYGVAHQPGDQGD